MGPAFVEETSLRWQPASAGSDPQDLQVIESKRNAIRKGLVYEMLNAQDTVFCSHFARRSVERNERQNQGGVVEEVFQGLGNFE